MHTLSERLDTALDSHLSELRATWGELIRSDDFRRAYPLLLKRTYHYVKYSCLLMERAIARIGSTSPIVSNYLLQHLDEERGHDEWLLSDLEALGYPRALVLAAIPDVSVAGMVGTQSYFIEEGLPLALFGYIYVLERHPPQAEMLHAVSRNHKIPMSAMGTFLRHSSEDIRHGEELALFLDSGAIPDAEQEVIVLSAEATAQHVKMLYSSIQRRAVDTAGSRRSGCVDWVHDAQTGFHK